jgi:hypothetical protein
MTALEITERRQHEIQMESEAVLQISASASFMNALAEEFHALGQEVRREGYDFVFDQVIVRLDPRLPVNSFLIELT